MKIVVFEDHLVGQLSPITIGRPAYAISCGSYRLVDWIDELQLPWSGLVRPHLRTLQEQDYGVTHLLQPTDQPILMLNARMVPSQETLKWLCALKQQQEPMT
ncbi:MAG TPA: glucose-1-phosphate thymidylyltransferase, partial [Planctomycetaceae bacterium]|nr:glucose-1-phosphate thymidylyltransferase [Planctomycetaceae bacterium]